MLPLQLLLSTTASESPFAVLPHINAGLNALTTVLIVVGLISIKAGRESAHKKLMVAAALTSTAFLACYLVYHFNVGSVKFEREGALLRILYFTVLITHVVLAAIQLPLILRTIWLGIRIDRVSASPDLGARLRAKHRSIARITAPIWLYVSVTGVVVYWMLYRM